MAPKQQNTTLEPLSQSDFQSLLQEQVRMAVCLTLATILEAEVSALIGALPYQRTTDRRDYRNGHYTRDLETTYPTAVACLRRNLDACLTFHTFAKAHWKTIRTTNVIEQLYNEVKRRTKKMAAAFRNENSCLLMFYAIEPQ